MAEKHQVIGVGAIDVSEPARPDGYQPLALGLMIWAGITGFPHDERYWFMASAARKLDLAHRQLERARDGTSAYASGGKAPEDALVVLGDVELALVAMHRAIEMACQASGRFKVHAALPASVQAKREAVKELRDAYEHIDHRALGHVDRDTKDLTEAHSVFAASEYGRPLIERREVRYRSWSLGIDEEATELLQAVRQYLRDAWVELCDRKLAGGS